MSRSVFLVFLATCLVCGSILPSVQAQEPTTTAPAPFVTSIPLDELLGNGTVYDGSEHDDWGWGPNETIPIVQSGRTRPLTEEDLKNVTMVASGYKEAFALYKTAWNRNYETDLEEQRRYRFFLRNMANAYWNQTENPEALFGANNFSDLSPYEFLPAHNLTEAFTHFTNKSANRGSNSPGVTDENGLDILQNPFDQEFALYDDDNSGQYISKGKGRNFWQSEELVNAAPPSTTPLAGVTGEGRAFFAAEDQIPAVLDWRKYGAVTPVKAQGSCGGCWAFATAGNIEGSWRINGYGLVELSEQNLISCDTFSGNLGCSGGVMQYAYNFIIKYQQGYSALREHYPYTSAAGRAPWCNSAQIVPGAKIDSYVVIAKDENVMASYLANVGPIAVAVDSTSWQSYIGGILTNCISIRVDHAVLIVGYDLTYYRPYWVIKNSWGTTWGEQGYIRIAKGSNQCLVTRNPSTAFTVLGAALPTEAPSTLPTTTGQPNLNNNAKTPSHAHAVRPSAIVLTILASLCVSVLLW